MLAVFLLHYSSLHYSRLRNNINFRIFRFLFWRLTGFFRRRDEALNCLVLSLHFFFLKRWVWMNFDICIDDGRACYLVIVFWISLDIWIGNFYLQADVDRLVLHNFLHEVFSIRTWQFCIFLVLLELLFLQILLLSLLLLLPLFALSFFKLQKHLCVSFYLFSFSFVIYVVYVDACKRNFWLSLCRLFPN